MVGEVEVADGRVGVYEVLSFLGEDFGAFGGFGNGTSAASSVFSLVPIVCGEGGVREFTRECTGCHLYGPGMGGVV